MEEIRDVREYWKHSVASSHGSPGLLILSRYNMGIEKAGVDNGAVQWVKAPATKPDDLGLIHGAQRIERKWTL